MPLKRVAAAVVLWGSDHAQWDDHLSGIAWAWVQAFIYLLAERWEPPSGLDLSTLLSKKGKCEYAGKV